MQTHITEGVYMCARCVSVQRGAFNKLEVFALNVNDMQLLGDWVQMGSVNVQVYEVPSV